MSFRIVLAGVIYCDDFNHICSIADYLYKNLPNFSYERIEKSVSEWPGWLAKTNIQYNWHHRSSPLIWKQFACENSKPYYIGGGSEFLEYCHSYYNVDTFVNIRKLEELSDNYLQYRRNVEATQELIKEINKNLEIIDNNDNKNKIVVCISNAKHPLGKLLVKSLINVKLPEDKESGKITNNRSIYKIYLYDDDINDVFENEFYDLKHGSNGTKVRRVYPLGFGLTKADLIIILDHLPFNPDDAIGDWLEDNKEVMRKIAQKINASGPNNLRILLPNLGPCCYNATFLTQILRGVDKRNIVVATSDLGLEIIPPLSEITKIPKSNIYCPPVWGFVGINHLVDARTCIHRYDAFYPYERYQKVKNSTLKIGYITPQMRTFEYLMYNDDTLWCKVVERKDKDKELENKCSAVVNLVKVWLSGPGSNDIVNIGVLCNGSFNLKLEGVFSQPCRFEDGFWVPAKNFLLPKDPQVKINYLEKIAEHILQLEKGTLPRIKQAGPTYSTRAVSPPLSKKLDLRFAEELLEDEVK